MRVLHLVTSLNPGGIERWVLQMLEVISRTECEMDVCCKGGSLGKWADQATTLGATVLLNPFTPDHVLFGMRLAQILKKGKYDIFHIHTGAFSGFPAWIGHCMNVKVITTFHSTDFSSQSNLPFLLKQLRYKYCQASIKYAIKFSDFVVGVSQSTLDTILVNSDKFIAKCAVIYHGAKIFPTKTKQSKNLFRTNLGWPENSQLIINVGRFCRTKNHCAVVEIFKKINEIIPDTRLVLVGDGDLRQEIEQLAHELFLGDKVAFLGFRNDAAQIIGFCDLMLMPSLVEGFGITAMEASAAGIPVVGSGIPGLLEAVENGVTGVLLKPQDLNGMADAIFRLLSDTDLSKKMGEAGRQRVQKHFSLEYMASCYLALYRTALKRFNL